MKKIIFYICIYMLGMVSLLHPQVDSIGYSLYGVVTDEQEIKLKNVNVSVKNILTNEIISDITNSTGEFAFKLNEGTYEIIIKEEGYKNYKSNKIRIEASQSQNIIIVLSEKIYTTDIIDVEGVFRQNQDDLRTSLINIAPKNVKILPGSVEDVFRSLRSLPGVTAPNDFTSQLVIRGSGPDQNLIIMDDVEIFNPYRLYGLVSMFNPETLNDITLITGGFPAKYGDRLSAVLDVLNKEGIRDKYFGMISNINIASANVIFQGKMPLSVPGSWIISSRRTYYDLIIGPFAKNAGLITDNSTFPNFTDLQFKLSFGPLKNNKILINGIFSKDGVDIVSGKDRKEPDSVNVNDVTRNDILSLSWHYFPTSKFISRTTLSYYKNNGDNEFEGDILDPLIDKENLSPAQRDSLKAIGALLGLNFDSKYYFSKYSLVNRSIYIKGKNKFEFGGGFDIIKTDLKYSLQLDEQFKAFLKSLPGFTALLNDFDVEGNNNYRGNIYAQGRFNLFKNFYFQPSVRLDYYSFLKKFYFSPRINFGYAIDPLTTLRASVGLYFQSPGYEKLVDGQTFFDLTGTNGENLKAENAIHYIIGIERWLNNELYIKVEGYYKQFDNLIVQQKLSAYKYIFSIADPANQDPNYIKNPSNWIRSQNKVLYDSVTAVPVNEGNGNAYGIEFSLEKRYLNPKTKFYGWLNYSLSYANRWRETGITLPYRFDQRHVVNIVLNYRFLIWLEIGARWTYASNFPYTPPVGITPRVVNDTIVVNPFTQQVVFNLDYGGDQNRFSQKRPDYHRLDLRITAYTKFWNVDWSFYIDVMNVYNRKNVIGYNYALNSDLSLKKKVVGMIPILPTIGVCARF